MLDEKTVEMLDNIEHEEFIQNMEWERKIAQQGKAIIYSIFLFLLGGVVYIFLPQEKPVEHMEVGSLKIEIWALENWPGDKKATSRKERKIETNSVITEDIPLMNEKSFKRIMDKIARKHALKGEKVVEARQFILMPSGWQEQKYLRKRRGTHHSTCMDALAKGESP